MSLTSKSLALNLIREGKYELGCDIHYFVESRTPSGVWVPSPVTGDLEISLVSEDDDIEFRINLNNPNHKEWFNKYVVNTYKDLGYTLDNFDSYSTYKEAGDKLNSKNAFVSLEDLKNEVKASLNVETSNRDAAILKSLKDSEWTIYLRNHAAFIGLYNAYPDFDRSRNYALFGFLSRGVRSWFPNNGMEARRIPEDISPEGFAVVASDGCDGHSHSYVTYEELENIGDYL